MEDTDGTADGPYLTIGQLAERTGLSVKTIRFWSDAGVVPPTGRTRAGYRLYDLDALARFELVRTLRELGVGLDGIRRVLERQVGLPELAGLHARALDAQIRVLRLRRSVLRAVAKRGSTPEELMIVHELARLSAEERQRILDDFWDEVFGDLDIDQGVAERMRAARPELPDEPSPEQVDAWVELARLVEDPGFRAKVRSMSERHAEARAAGEDMSGPSEEAGRQAQLVADKAGEALAAGIDPASPEARPVADELAAALLDPAEAGDPAARLALADRWAEFTDGRVERYWQLLATINGWGSSPSVTPAHEWAVAALRASARS
jgi:DNA-binding transcriptional MerR regulator